MVNDDIKLEEVGIVNGSPISSDGTELGLDDLGGNFLKNPIVGESVQFTVKSVHKQSKNLVIKNPKTNQSMNTALTGVDYKIEIYTMDGKLFSVSNWELWGKLKAIWKQLAGDRKDFTMQNQVVRIKHLRDGTLKEHRGDGKENYEVAVKRDDKFYTLDRKTSEWVAA